VRLSERAHSTEAACAERSKGLCSHHIAQQQLQGVQIEFARYGCLIRCCRQEQFSPDGRAIRPARNEAVKVTIRNRIELRPLHGADYFGDRSKQPKHNAGGVRARRRRRKPRVIRKRRK